MSGHERREAIIPFVLTRLPVKEGTLALSTVVLIVLLAAVIVLVLRELGGCTTCVVELLARVPATGAEELVIVVRRCFALLGIDRSLLDTSLLADTVVVRSFLDAVLRADKKSGCKRGTVLWICATDCLLVLDRPE